MDAKDQHDKDIARLARQIRHTRRQLEQLSKLYDSALRLREYSEGERHLYEQYNYLLLQNTPDMICIMDMQKRFRLGTSSFLAFFGTNDPSDLLDKKPTQMFDGIMDPEWIAETDRKVDLVLEMKRPISYSDEVVRGGVTTIYTVNILPAIDSDGDIMGVIAQIHDSTELEMMRREAEASTRAKSAFLANMSHEIRTPLNAVIGMAEIAKRRAGDEAPQTIEMLGEILTASKHLLALLNDVLDLSKIESGKFTLSYEPFPLRRAMDAVANIFVMRCSEKEIKFKTNVSELPDLSVLGDELRLKQVLINLLGNAVKFTPEGGEVSLLVTPRSVTEDAIKLDFAVSDTGIGMTPEQTQKLFSAFVQADASITKRFGGTGLGLAISQRLISEMGDKIRVASEPDKGSVFSFSLSLLVHSVLDAVEPEGEDTGVPDLTGMHILLTEDLEINRMILMELLEDTHAEVDEAESGERAVEMFRSSQLGYYGLIFMDIQMPGIDGYETTKRIRAMDRGDAQSVPIVAMTANAYREDVERALASGMNAHLSKPIEVDHLMAFLSKELGRR